MKKNNIKKAISLGLIAILFLAMSVTGLAKSGDNESADASTYTVGSYTYTTGENFNVKLIVEGNSIYTEQTVALAASSSAYTVRDVLLAAQTNDSKLSFNAYGGSAIGATDTYFASVTYDGTTESPSGSWDGWVFRVNDKFPLENAGWGTTIATTYVAAGDEIHCYMDDTEYAHENTYYTKVSSVNYEEETLTVNVKASYQYYGSAPDYAWTITNFASYSGVQVQIYNGDTLVDSATTDSAGDAKFEDLSLISNTTYTVKVLSATASGKLVSTSASYDFTI